MNVLIMEDEALIREGLKSDVDWEKFGIQRVETAPNGEVGYRMASELRPDIILTDIRMPRMDGITAVRRLRDLLPLCSVIFISAYPEKNYFKDAIHLKAVSFIEKPIDMGELESVLREAVEEQKKHRKNDEYKEKYVIYHRQKMVERLCRQAYTSSAECRKELLQAGIDAGQYAVFLTVAVKYFRGIYEEEEQRWNAFTVNLESALLDSPYIAIWGQKQSDLVVFHFFAKQPSQVERFLSWIKAQMQGITRWYILKGSSRDTVLGLQKSYQDAVLCLNQAFYLPYGSVVAFTEDPILVAPDISQWKMDFSQELQMGNMEALLEQMEDHRHQLLRQQRLHYRVVRDFYLYLYGEIERYTEKNHMYIRELDEEQTSRRMLEQGNFEDLQNTMVACIHALETHGEISEESAIIVQIKKYIAANYQNSQLSVNGIAENFGKSVSHLCVIFKKNTGITLNQYLTDMRMEKAQILLDNPRYSIKEVAEQTGFADSSYFARAFKKHTGKTPSEYRGDSQ